MSASFAQKLEAIKRRLEREAAKRMLAAGKAIVEEAHADFSVPNPYPYTNSSKAGQFPRLRTGELNAGIVMDAKHPAHVIRNGFVLKIGIKRKVDYGITLMKKGRLSVKDSYLRVKAKVDQILRGGTP